MAAKPRRTCGQNISLKSAVRLSKRAHAESNREQAKTERRQQARIEPALQRAGDRAATSCAAPVTSMILPICQRIVLPDIGEKNRHQIDRAEQADAEAKAQHATDRRTAALSASSSSTTGCTAFRVRKANSRRRDRAQREQPKADEGKPAGLRRLLQPDLQARQRQRHQRQRNHVEFLQMVETGLARGNRNGVATQQ